MSRADAAPPPPAGRPRALRAGVATHPGRVRERNEDRPYADLERGIFIVVDGIGGHAAGETAAEAALELLKQRLDRPAGTPEERIREAIAVANNQIVAQARANPELEGMGCVLTVAVVEDSAVTVGHVGDSRLYRLGRGRMDKITRDHSPVGEREDRGELSEAEAMAHPRRNEVYRSLGAEEHSPLDRDFIDVVTLPFESDQALLLCSDGLTDLVTSGQIQQIVSDDAGHPETVAKRLVQAALAAGGKDNVSVVFAEGPRFAAGWDARGTADPWTSGSDSSSVGRARGWLERRWVQFALGAVFGAAIAIALSMLGWGPAGHKPGVGAVDTRVPVVLEVGAGRRFHTIADALGAARPGDSVRVAPGTYREQVRMEPGVTLFSAIPRAAVLTPTAAGALVEGAALVAIVVESAGSGRISGFVIRSAPEAPIDVGIRLRNASVAVEDVEITGARVAGIVVEGSGRAVPSVTAGWIHDNAGAGAIVRAGASARLAYNRISDNGRAPHAPAPGVELEPGASAELRGNVIAGNGGPGVRGVTPRNRAAILTSNQFSSGARVSRPPVAPAP